jgi:two-component sensor histidine kinase
LALVVTELVHNALEHGVSAEGSKVEVHVVRDAQIMQVAIVDDGVGVPKDFTLDEVNLGLQIVQTLTQNELAGSLELVQLEKGTEFRIKFPINR